MTVTFEPDHDNPTTIEGWGDPDSNGLCELRCSIDTFAWSWAWHNADGTVAGRDFLPKTLGSREAVESYIIARLATKGITK